MIPVESALTHARSVQGWLTDAQASRLYELASGVDGPGTIVEIGSFHGKSTILLSSAAVEGVVMYAIDPHAGNDRGPGEWEGSAADGQSDREQFEENLCSAGVADRVTSVREFSDKAHSFVPGNIDLLFVDGAHGYRPATADIRDWGARVELGGVMAIHDVFHSVFVTAAVAVQLFWSKEWRLISRDTSLVTYKRESMSGLSRVANLGRHVACLPWFARNCMIKVLKVLRLEQATRLLGHKPHTPVI